MHRKPYINILILSLSMILLLVLYPPPIYAQSGVHAITPYALTVYSQPDRSGPIIGVMIPHAKIILEGRDESATWVLGRSIDGAVRGWMESRYLELSPSINITDLKLTMEAMFVRSHPFRSSDYNNISLYDYPVVPLAMGEVITVFERGQRSGSDIHAVSKIGDCISDNQHFLSPFGWNEYNLGGYTQLQSVITHFSTSLAYDSLAAYDGLVTSAVLDPLFANPLACLPGETPLRCEYRVHKPSVAVIMFGAQDLLFVEPEDFDTNLRRIIHETLEAGVVPILSTFPGNLERWDMSVYYNQIVVQIALDYNIPLMNLWLALDSLPNHGLNVDGRHLSLPLTTSGDLSGKNLTRGYPLRNLVTLQTLDAVWRSVMQ